MSALERFAWRETRTEGRVVVIVYGPPESLRYWVWTMYYLKDGWQQWTMN